MSSPLTPLPSTPFLSPAEAAACLRTSEYRVKRLAQKGQLAKVKDGRAIWFTVENLNAYIDRQRVRALNPYQTSRPKHR